MCLRSKISYSLSLSIQCHILFMRGVKILTYYLTNERIRSKRLHATGVNVTQSVQLVLVMLEITFSIWILLLIIPASHTQELVTTTTLSPEQCLTFPRFTNFLEDANKMFRSIFDVRQWFKG